MLFERPRLASSEMENRSWTAYMYVHIPNTVRHRWKTLQWCRYMYLAKWAAALRGTWITDTRFFAHQLRSHAVSGSQLGLDTGCCVQCLFSYRFPYHDRPRKHDQGKDGVYMYMYSQFYSRERIVRNKPGRGVLKHLPDPLPEGCVARIYLPSLEHTCYFYFFPGAKADGDYWLGTEST